MTEASAVRPACDVASPPAESPFATGEAGRVHAFTTGSMVDGPGVRTVVWTSGCELRCVYCHNPDSWSFGGGEPAEADAVVARVVRAARFMGRTGGGVTVSGGEPLVQWRFATRILRGCRAEGIHTALDTNGWLGDRLSDEDLGAADLVLLDLKSFDPETHRRVTAREVEPVLRFARRLSDLERPAWIRFVLVPGVTDAPENVAGLAAFVATLRNVERVEVLPFHQMGRDRWRRLGLRYALDGIEPPDADAVRRAVDAFASRGLNAVAR